MIQRLVTLGNTVWPTVHKHCNYTFSVSDETKSKTGGDFLTCGGCRRKYDLSDLTKFVQHKVLDCNKENSKLSKGEIKLFAIEARSVMRCCPDVSGEEEDGSEAGEQCSKRLGLGSPRVSGSGQVDSEAGDIKLEDSKPVVRDTGANTVKSGMSPSLCDHLTRV